MYSRALGVSSYRQGDVDVKRKTRVEPPDVRKPLDGIACMGKDGAVKEREFARECVFKSAPHEGTAVGLKMGVGIGNVLSGPEDSEWEGARGRDKFFRCI
jgi:hypothetical protein